MYKDTEMLLAAGFLFGAIYNLHVVERDRIKLHTLPCVLLWPQTPGNAKSPAPARRMLLSWLVLWVEDWT